MKLTKKQREFLKFAKNQAKPIAWLGSVRAGKTFGSVWALLDHMELHGGKYVITAAGHSNIDINIWPVVVDQIEARQWDYSMRKINPKRIDCEHGSITFFVGGDAGSQKALQGATVQGALTDEVLLHHETFLMQLISRFTFDNALWIMTANKAEPNHWIKTDWIDDGKVAVFESTADDNPHVSEKAKKWWNSLLTGPARARMLNNEWASDHGLIREPEVTSINDSLYPDERFLAVWLDQSKGHHGVLCEVYGERLHIRKAFKCRSYSELADECRSVTYAGVPVQVVMNSQGENNPRTPGRGLFLKPDLTKWAKTYTENRHTISISPQLDDISRAFRRWSWEPADATDTEIRPGPCTNHVKACVMAVYRFKRLGKVISMDSKS